MNVSYNELEELELDLEDMDVSNYDRLSELDQNLADELSKALGRALWVVQELEKLVRMKE